MTEVRPLAGSPLVSFVGRRSAEGRSYEHVLFFGRDKDLHELRFDGIWHDNDLTEMAGARQPASRSPLTGYCELPVEDSRNVTCSEHVFYVDPGGRLCEVLYDWTEWGSAPVPSQPTGAQWAPGSPLTSLFGGAARRENVVYIGRDGHLQELGSDGHHWHSDDLTQLAEHTLPPSTSPIMSPLASFWDPTPSHGAGGTQHVFYIGTDGHARQLSFDGASWRPNDLNTAARASIRPAMSSHMMSPLTGFFGGASRRASVFYIGKDEHVQQLWSDGQGWHSNDLTEAARPADQPSLRPMTPLMSYSWPEDGTEHVFYIGASGDLWELWYDGAWHSTDLTKAAPDAEAPALAPMSPLTGYSWPEDGTEHVFYIGASGDLWELWYDGTWHSTDLTKVA